MFIRLQRLCPYERLLERFQTSELEMQEALAQVGGQRIFVFWPHPHISSS
jgi:hypothetical protein